MSRNGPDTPDNTPDDSQREDSMGLQIADQDEAKRAAEDDRPQSQSMAKGVFYPSAIIIGVAILLAIIFPDRAEELLNALESRVVAGFGWYYMLIVVGFVAFAIFVGLSRFGDIRLGRDDEEAQFSMPVWFSMLFAAGMGIGLVFFGVTEPLTHFATPRPGVEGSPVELAQLAFAQTFLHWGIHAWAIYVACGLGIAYTVHRKGRPVSIRWALEPLLGTRVRGRIGDVIDTIAIVGTLFGVATSLGFGVLQIAAGLDFVGISANHDTGHVLLIIGITAVATISVVSGVERGMKWLANINMSIAGLIWLFVLIAGPTVFLLQETVQSLGVYLQNIVVMSFDTSAHQGEAGQQWQGTWSTFYWGWWISWSPFVGVFIARVSRGRTVREFVAGVLLVPALVGVLWFSVLGGTAIYRQMYGEGGLLTAAGEVGLPEETLFRVLEGLPWSLLLSIIVVIVIVLFFVTSSDSGSFVIDMLAHGGNPEPPTWSRAMWSILEGATAIALLLAGGLAALQTAAIMIALPFSVVLILICAATLTAFNRETQATKRLERMRNRRELRESFEEQIDERLEQQAEEATLPTGSRSD